jgi:glutamine synthetase
MTDDWESTRYDAVLDAAAEAELRLVRFLYCDLGSMVRGKATHALHLPSRIRDGIALTCAQMAMNALDQLQDIPGMTAVGEVRIVPDPDSFVILPYAPRTGAMFSSLINLDRNPSPTCPRTFLRRVIADAATQGLRADAAFELEFFLAKEVDGALVPVDQSLCFSSAGMNSTAAFTDDLIAALEAQDIAVEQAMPEYGPGQQEITIRHADLLKAADRHLWTKETVKAIAHRHNLVASFAPKPFADEIGSGGHVHLSLWDSAGVNVLHDPGAPRGLSRLGEHFVAGMLKHLPALSAITCPTVNSYKRLQPHAWASAFVCYGYDNREAAVRIPSTFWGDPAASANLELKTVDNSCNPYLALGAVMAAGLDGIKGQLDPGPPLDVDPGLLDDAERERRGYQRLPPSLDAALDALERDAVITGALGPELAAAYAKIRRSEADAYREMSEEAQYADHFARY